MVGHSFMTGRDKDGKLELLEQNASPSSFKQQVRRVTPILADPSEDRPVRISAGEFACR